MNNISNNFSIHMNYLDFAENDFFLNCVGFDDFHYIKPLKIFRIQKIYTLHYVLSGKVTLEIYGKKFRVKKHDMFFIPPDESMRYYPDEDNLWSYLWFEFSGERSVFYQNKMGFDKNNPVKHAEKDSVIYDVIRDFVSKTNENNTASYYSALSLFYSVVDTFIDINSDSSPSLRKQIIKYIDCHYHDPALRIENICMDFNISHSYLCKIFTGSKSAKSRLIERRMTEAKKLLLTTNLNISEIGYSVGYTDTAHFMKCFKKYFEITAGEYRKNSE